MAVSESGIGGNNLEQALVEQRHVQPQARDAEAIKMPQHWIFDSLEAFSAATFSSLSWRRAVTISAKRSVAG
jgi:hypothetical protein